MKQEKEMKKMKLANEPTADMAETVVITCRLPNGGRVSRRFHSIDTVELLYDFIGSLDDIGKENLAADIQIL